MRRAWLGLAMAALGGVIACAVWLSLRGDSWFRTQAESARRKEYVRAVAEGVRFREFERPGVDRFSFKSCRVEKRRSGAFTLGAFNVLIVEGLVLNLPEERGEPDGQDHMFKGGFAESLLRSQGLSQARFSGVRITGLTVNRAHANGVARVFSASRAESGMGKESVRLTGCVVILENGGEARVSDARLELKPEAALVYRLDGAERRLSMPGLGR